MSDRLWRSERAIGDVALVATAIAVRPLLKRILAPPATAASRTDAVPFVFVVGFPRSGTTWVQQLIAAQPGVATATESNVYAAVGKPLRTHGAGIAGWGRVLYRYDRMARRGHGGLHHWVARRTMVRLVLTAIAHRSGDARLDAQGVVEGVLDDFLARHPNATALVEKSPGNLYWARDILGRWPTARIVEVVRDGRDACVSRQALDRAYDVEPMTHAARFEQWGRAIEAGRALREDPALAARVHRVRYEDLQEDPVAELSALYRFLGFDCSVEVVTAALEAHDFATTRPEGSRHMREGVVGGWRDVLDAADRDRFWSIAGEAAAASGYEP